MSSHLLLTLLFHTNPINLNWSHHTLSHLPLTHRNRPYYLSSHSSPDLITPLHTSLLHSPISLNWSYHVLSHLLLTCCTRSDYISLSQLDLITSASHTLHQISSHLLTLIFHTSRLSINLSHHSLSPLVLTTRPHHLSFSHSALDFITLPHISLPHLSNESQLIAPYHITSPPTAQKRNTAAPVACTVNVVPLSGPQ